jgi:hypothetical protein
MSISVAASFQTPPVRTRRGDSEVVDVYTEFLRIYNMEVTRRLANVNFNRQFPDTDDDDGNTVVRRLPFDEEYAIDDDFLSDFESEDTEYENNSDSNEILLEEKKMLQKDIEESMEQDCPLCLEELKRAECVTTSCKHNFCVNCYEKYKKKSSCPCCRQNVLTLTRYVA